MSTPKKRKTKYDFDVLEKVTTDQIANYYEFWEKNKGFFQNMQEIEDVFKKDKRPKLDFETFFRNMMVNEEGIYPVQRLDENGNFLHYDMYKAKDIADRIFDRGVTAKQLSREDLSNLGDIDAIKQTFGPTFEGWEKVYKKGLSNSLYEGISYGRTKEEILKDLVEKGKGTKEKLSKVIDKPFDYQQLKVYNEFLDAYDEETYDDYVVSEETDEQGNKISITRKQQREREIKALEDQIAELQQDKKVADKYNDRMSDYTSIPQYTDGYANRVNNNDLKIEQLQAEIQSIKDRKQNQINTAKRIASGKSVPKARRVQTIGDPNDSEMLETWTNDLTMEDKISQLRYMGPGAESTEAGLQEEYKKMRDYEKSLPGIGGGPASTFTKILHPYDWFAHKMQGTTMLEDTSLGLGREWNNPLISGLDYASYAIPYVSMVRGAQLTGDAIRGAVDTFKYAKDDSDLISGLGWNALSAYAGRGLMKPLGKGFLRPMGKNKMGINPNYQIIPKKGQSSLVLKPGYKDLKTINLPGNRIIQYGNPTKQIQRNFAQSTGPATPQQVQLTKNFDKYGQQYVDFLTKQQRAASPFLNNTWLPRGKFDQFVMQPYFLSNIVFNPKNYQRDVSFPEPVINENVTPNNTALDGSEKSSVKENTNMKKTNFKGRKLKAYNEGGQLPKAQAGRFGRQAVARRSPVTIRDIKSNLQRYYPGFTQYPFANLSKDSIMRLGNLEQIGKDMSYSGIPGLGELADMANSPGVKALFDSRIDLNEIARRRFNKPYSQLNAMESRELEDIASKQIMDHAGNAFKTRKTVRTVSDIIRRLEEQTVSKGKTSLEDLRFMFNAFKRHQSQGTSLFDESAGVLGKALNQSIDRSGQVDNATFIGKLKESLEALKGSNPDYFSTDLSSPSGGALRKYMQEGFPEMIRDFDARGQLDSDQYQGQMTLEDFADGNQPFAQYFDGAVPMTAGSWSHPVMHGFDNAMDLQSLNGFQVAARHPDQESMILDSKQLFNRGAHTAAPLSVLVNDLNLSTDSYPLQLSNNLRTVLQKSDKAGVFPNQVFMGYRQLNAMDFMSQILNKKRTLLEMGTASQTGQELAEARAQIKGIEERGPLIRATMLQHKLDKIYDKFAVPSEERLPLLRKSGDSEERIFAPQFGIAKDPTKFIPPEERYMYKSGGVPTAQEDGDYIEAELTEKEILDLAKQGFIIEDM